MHGVITLAELIYCECTGQAYGWSTLVVGSWGGAFKLGGFGGVLTESGDRKHII